MTYKEWKGKETFAEMCLFLNGEIHHTTYDAVSCRVKQTDISLSKNERNVDISLHRPTCADMYARIDNVGALILTEGDNQYFKKHAVLQPKNESGDGLHISPKGDVELLTRNKSLSVDFR
jgi:hypothetical protein